MSAMVAPNTYDTKANFEGVMGLQTREDKLYLREQLNNLEAQETLIVEGLYNAHFPGGITGTPTETHTNRKDTEVDRNCITIDPHTART